MTRATGVTSSVAGQSVQKEKLCSVYDCVPVHFFVEVRLMHMFLHEMFVYIVEPQLF